MTQILNFVGKTFAPILAVFVVLGCGKHNPTPIPLPQSWPLFDDEPGQPLSQHDADRQYRGRLLELVDGQTTRTAVLNVMGEPDNASADGRTILYDWTVREKQEGTLRRSFVLAAFDASGLLVRHKAFANAEKYGGMTVPSEALAAFEREAK